MSFGVQLNPYEYHNLTYRSFRYSNSSMPLINIDLGFSAFLQPGPAVEVINKILSFGPVGARGGGPQARDLDQLDQRQIAILKKKLRGAKVSITWGGDRSYSVYGHTTALCRFFEVAMI